MKCGSCRFVQVSRAVVAVAVEVNAFVAVEKAAGAPVIS